MPRSPSIALLGPQQAPGFAAGVTDGDFPFDIPDGYAAIVRDQVMMFSAHFCTNSKPLFGNINQVTNVICTTLPARQLAALSSPDSDE